MHPKLSLLILPFVSSAAFAATTSLPPGVIDLNAVVGTNGSTLTAPRSSLTPTAQAPIAEPPCVELKPTRFAKADLEIDKELITKNGERYDFKEEMVCRIQGPVAVFEIPAPSAQPACHFVRSSVLNCEADESGKKRVVVVNAIVVEATRPFFTGDTAKREKSFHASLYTGRRDDEKVDLQAPTSSAFITPDTTLADGRFSLAPAALTCHSGPEGEPVCEHIPVSYGAKLSLEDRP